MPAVLSNIIKRKKRFLRLWVLRMECFIHGQAGKSSAAPLIMGAAPGSEAASREPATASSS